MVLPNDGLRPVTWQMFDMAKFLREARLAGPTGEPAQGAGTSSGPVSQARAGNANLDGPRTSGDPEPHPCNHRCGVPVENRGRRRLEPSPATGTVGGHGARHGSHRAPRPPPHRRRADPRHPGVGPRPTCRRVPGLDRHRPARTTTPACSRFATAQLRAAPGDDIVAFDPPPDHLDPVEQFRFTADALLAELVGVDPTEHRPNWAGAPTAAFWFRRMAQETAVHRWDIEAAHGDPRPIEAALAVDGVDELGDTFLRSRHDGASPATARRCTSTPPIPRWPTARSPAASGCTGSPPRRRHHHEHGKGDMAGRGSASDLLLFVWNRRPVDITCFGEPDLLSWWAAHVRI